MNSSQYNKLINDWGGEDCLDLKKLAMDVSEVYAQNSKVEAILLGGSVSRNWQDEYSDIELLIFWKEEPADEDRKESIKKSAGKIIDFHPFEQEEWSETYVSQGVKFEISNFLTDTIQQIIKDVIFFFDTDLEKQCIVAAIDKGIPFHGELVITKMKERVSEYPDELRKAMIVENMDLGNRWNNRAALLYRQDWLMLYKVMVTVQTKLMTILFSLNRQYVPHPAFKWQRNSLELMEITPENAITRLESVFLNTPESSVKELQAIIQEVYRLIDRELPQIGISTTIDKSLLLRPKNEDK